MEIPPPIAEGFDVRTAGEVTQGCLRRQVEGSATGRKLQSQVQPHRRGGLELVRLQLGALLMRKFGEWRRVNRLLFDHACRQAFCASRRSLHGSSEIRSGHRRQYGGCLWPLKIAQRWSILEIPKGLSLPLGSCQILGMPFYVRFRHSAESASIDSRVWAVLPGMNASPPAGRRGGCCLDRRGRFVRPTPRERMHGRRGRVDAEAFFETLMVVVARKGHFS